MNHYCLNSYYQNELYHYGVKGMRWGIRKALRKNKANKKLSKKALAYDLKSGQSAASAAKARYKIRNNEDYVEKRTRKLKKNLGYTPNDDKPISRRKKANVKLSKKALAYDLKSEKSDALAAKARYKIHNNEAYIQKMKTKVNDLAIDEVAAVGYDYVEAIRKI